MKNLTKPDASYGLSHEEWKHAPSHTIAGMKELYEQLTPTKLNIFNDIMVIDNFSDS